MRRSLCLLLLLPVFSFAQRTYTPEEVNRLADLGRLWGILHYFHPAMADGTITTESLVVENAASLAADPSAENFKKAVANMLGKMNDPATRIISGEESKPVTYNIFSDHPDSVTVHQLENGVVYVACPTAAAKNEKLFQSDDFSIAALSKYKGIVFDFRNKEANSNIDEDQFSELFCAKFLGHIVEEQEIDPINEVFLQHSGFISQRISPFSIYYSGWHSESTHRMYKANYAAKKLLIPMMFIVNRQTDYFFLALLQSIQFAGKAFILFEGAADEYPRELNYDMPLADSLEVYVKIGYRTINNNYLLLPPDKIVPEIKSETFMKESAFFLESFKTKNQDRIQPNLSHKLPRLNLDSSMFVPLGERLLGLYNFWNAIHYFFPSKNLIGRNWDSVLIEYIPRFITVTDTFSYYRVLRSLVSEINDSHAEVSFNSDRTSLNNKFNCSPPLMPYKVENRLFILDIGKDSLQDLSRLHVWDEIISINDTPVKIYAEKFRKFVCASNEESYYHDVYQNFILDGERDSRIKLTIKRKLEVFDIWLKRTVVSVSDFSDTLANLSSGYPASKILKGNIGYVNMGVLTYDEIDSVMKKLWNTKALVFDIRNYPKGTAWGIVRYLTAKKVITHLNKMMLVDYSSIAGSGDVPAGLESYQVTLPRSDREHYKGKVVILCDNTTISQAEYSVMMIDVAGNGTVIGSQTTGADGNVARIIFPGGYSTNFSALGVYYPDGTITQRVGVKIDIEVKPTLAGLKAGRDEVLERAVRFINTGK